MKLLKHLLLILLLSTAATSLYSCSDEVEIDDMNKYKFEIENVIVSDITYESATVTVWIKKKELNGYSTDNPRLKDNYGGYYWVNSSNSDINRGKYVYKLLRLSPDTEYSIRLSYLISLDHKIKSNIESEILTSFTTLPR